MAQTLLDPRMLDTAQALPAMSGANLTGVASDCVLLGTSSGTSSSVDVTGSLSISTYNHYEAVGLARLVTDGEDLVWRTGSGSPYSAITSSDYRGSGVTHFNSGTANPNYSSASYMTFDGGQGMDNGYDCFFRVQFSYDADGTRVLFHQRSFFQHNTSLHYAGVMMAGAVVSMSAEPTGFTITASSGNVNVKRLALYGFKK